MSIYVESGKQEKPEKKYTMELKRKKKRSRLMQYLRKTGNKDLLKKIKIKGYTDE